MSWDELCDWIVSIDASKDPRHLIELRSTPIGGRGLFAKVDIPPSTVLIDIPALALLNIITLASIYPPNWLKLGATRLLSLHLTLAAYRRSHGMIKKVKRGEIDFWEPFLQSLPVEFDSIPLTWRSELGLELLKSLPESLRNASDKVSDRYDKDWNATREFWERNRSKFKDIGELVEEDYLIAWLNVNSRCIFFDAGEKENNLTLGPILDMMNHCQSRFTKPLQHSDTLSFSSPAPNSPDPLLLKGSELLFSYGAHEDTLLFSEYGFRIGSTNNYNFLSLDDAISKLFQEQELVGEEKRKILEEKGYWNEFSLAAAPEPASVCFRTLVALRFLHLEIHLEALKGYDLVALVPFLELIDGERDEISKENERLVEKSAEKICEGELSRLKEGLAEAVRSKDSWTKRLKGMEKEDERWEVILGNWKDEISIVESVLSVLQAAEHYSA